MLDSPKGAFKTQLKPEQRYTVYNRVWGWFGKGVSEGRQQEQSLIYGSRSGVLAKIEAKSQLK